MCFYACANNYQKKRKSEGPIEFQTEFSSETRGDIIWAHLEGFKFRLSPILQLIKTMAEEHIGTQKNAILGSVQILSYKSNIACRD